MWRMQRLETMSKTRLKPTAMPPMLQSAEMTVKQRSVKSPSLLEARVLPPDNHSKKKLPMRRLGEARGINAAGKLQRTKKLSAQMHRSTWKDYLR